MSSIRGQHIKQIFRNGSWKRGLLHSLCALTWYCSAARNGAPSFFLVENQTLCPNEWSILQIQWRGHMLQLLAVAILPRFSDVACLSQDSLKVEPEKMAARFVLWQNHGGYCPINTYAWSAYYVSSFSQCTQRICRVLSISYVWCSVPHSQALVTPQIATSRWLCRLGQDNGRGLKLLWMTTSTEAYHGRSDWDRTHLCCFWVKEVLTHVSFHSAQVFRLLLKTSVERNNNELKLFLVGFAIWLSLWLLWKST